MVSQRKGPIFGSFALLAKLSQGDLGDLFLARSQGAGGFEKLVIIKRIHSKFTADPEIAELFLSEARTAARVEHPNLRNIFEIGSTDSHYYIALEYLEGVPLVDILLQRKRDRRLADTRLLATLLVQACEGLHAAHSSQEGAMVHGDINPRSVFVTASGTVKILDFDIVEMRGLLASRHGFVRRTSAYMSPEEVRGGNATQRSDIFSIGVVAWEALSGRRLFKQQTRKQTLAAIDRGRIPTIQSFRPEVGDALNACVMRALNRDPSLRFQKARDFGSALERAIQAEGPPITPVAIASLLEEAFIETLREQRDFVRKARGGLTRNLTVDEGVQEAPTRVASNQSQESPEDPDDWSKGHEAATKVADWSHPDLAQILESEADPFFEIAEHADFSRVTEPPLWSDTRNLVLSELLGEDADGEVTGEVQLDDDYSIDSYDIPVQFEEDRPVEARLALAPSTPRPLTDVHSPAPPWQAPSPLAPSNDEGMRLARPPSTIDSSKEIPLQRPFGLPETISEEVGMPNHGSARGPSSIADILTEQVPSIRPQRKGRLRLLLLLVLVAALGVGAWALGSLLKQTPAQNHSAPAQPIQQQTNPISDDPPEVPKAASDEGKRAAAGILAAAANVDAAPVQDAGAEPSFLELIGPKHTRVYLDGEEVGRLPLSPLEILPGVHRIKADSPGKRSQTFEVELTPGQTETLRVGP